MLVEQHAQLRCGDQIVARQMQRGRIEPQGLQALAEIVVLDLGLEVEHAQRPWRGEAQERHAGGGVDQEIDEEVGFADLGRAAQHEHSARREQAWGDDVVGHRAGVVEQRTEGEGRHGGHRRSGGDAFERRAVTRDMERPDGVGFALEPIFRPGRLEAGGIVAADCLPALIGGQAPLMHLADIISDGGAGTFEAGPGILGAGADRRGEHAVETG